MSEPMLAVKARRVITPLQDLRDAVVLLEGRAIAQVGLQSNVPIPEQAQVIDVGDKIVAPGFIDLHHHGALGCSAGDGIEAVRKIAQYIASTGGTSWLPTVNNLPALAGIVAARREGTGGAEVAGIHMEGPFLTPKAIPGLQGMDSGLLKPSIVEFQRFLQASDGLLRLMGVAPELDGACELIREMRRSGVVPAVAHTKATYEQFMRGVEAGIRHVTHAYNVMSGLHHRKPNVVGGMLTCDQVTAEIIADSYHVSPVAIDVLLRCKGYDKVAVITDNVALAGLPDGSYESNGRTVVKKDGVSRVAGTTPDQDNTMAGSEWPINHNLRTLVNVVHVPLAAAIRMATLTPAAIVDLRSKGSLEPGKDADLVVIDEQIHVYLTIVGGRVVYKAPNLTA